MPPNQNRDIFINCPFSAEYLQNFRGIIFAILRSGFVPRCAQEADDGSQNRLEKIFKIIAECRYGIHDISFTDLDDVTGLPRFNMPLELGMFLGCKRFGARSHKLKRALILDREPYRYQKFISDISGHDIRDHGGTIGGVIANVASWLRDEVGEAAIPGGKAIVREFHNFSTAVPELCRARQLEASELTFKDYRRLATYWIAENLGTVVKATP